MKRMKRVSLWLLLLSAAILTVFVGCEPRRGADNELVFTGPVEIGTTVGSRLPGTDLEVRAVADDAAQILIDGQIATKKSGDSLDWRGALDFNVDLDLALRILWIADDIVQTAGTAKLTVESPRPEAMPVQSISTIQYALPVSYSVRAGQRIPGTTITYVGKDIEKGAEFSGIEGYPFRKIADSLTWEGRLRDNVWVKLDLRVILFSDTTLQAGGVASIWVDQ